MASEVLSGAANASYTNNTGQNVRLVINYMSNTTSMTWAGVNVTASATTIGKDIQNITGEFRSAVTGKLISSRRTESALLTSDLSYAGPDPAGDIYELNVSNKRTNVVEVANRGSLLRVAPPKNQNGTYANPYAPNQPPARNQLVNTALLHWREQSQEYLTLENSLLPTSTSATIALTASGGPALTNQMFNGPDSLNFRRYIGGGYGALGGKPNIFYVPLTVSRGGNFPVELMLSSGQSFSAVCGAFNAIVIKEDGT